MKTLVAGVVGLALVVSAQVAGAYVVQVVTTVPVPSSAAAEDTAKIGDVVESAIRDVLDHAIAFTPTVVTIEDARVGGDRLYLILLIADADGESTMNMRATDRVPDSESSAQDADRVGGTARPGPVQF